MWKSTRPVYVGRISYPCTLHITVNGWMQWCAIKGPYPVWYPAGTHLCCNAGTTSTDIVATFLAGRVCVYYAWLLDTIPKYVGCGCGVPVCTTVALWLAGSMRVTSAQAFGLLVRAVGYISTITILLSRLVWSFLFCFFLSFEDCGLLMLSTVTEWQDPLVILLGFFRFLGLGFLVAC